MITQETLAIQQDQATTADKISPPGTIGKGGVVRAIDTRAGKGDGVPLDGDLPPEADDLQEGGDAQTPAARAIKAKLVDANDGDGKRDTGDSKIPKAAAIKKRVVDGTTKGPAGGDTTAEGPPYWLIQADFSDDERKALARQGKALPDGSYPIRNRGDLSNAVQAFGRAKNKSAAKAHILKRAKALGAMDLIPDEWKGDVNQETPTELITTLRMEGEIPGPIIVQSATPENGQTMRVKVPFYVGNSVAQAPGIDKRLYWKTERLPGIVAEGKRQITEAKQPLTVYARHAHATAGDRLPIGGIVDLEYQGRIGYAVMEIEPTSDGKDVQILLNAKKLNAVSLRTGRFQMEDVRVNGEPMLAPTIKLDGIDFAPDSPAMPTYGVEILQEDARVEDNKPPKKGGKRLSDEITLEGLKADHAELVEQIERPLRKQLESVTVERDALKQEQWELKRAALVKEQAAKATRDPQKAAKVEAILANEVKEAKTEAEVWAKTGPILMEVLTEQADTQSNLSTKEQLKAALFPAPKGGAGNQEIGQEIKKDDAKELTQEEVAKVGPLAAL